MTCNCNKCQGVKTYSVDVESKGLINDIELVTPEYFDTPFKEGITEGSTSTYKQDILDPLGGIIEPTQKVISDLGGYPVLVGLVDQIYGELGPYVKKNPTKWPYVYERIVSNRSIEKITPVEGAQFIIDSGYSSDRNVLRQEISYNSDRFLDLLDVFLAGGTGAIVLGLLGALCNLPSNPFGKVLDLLEGGIEGLTSKLKSFVEGVKKAIDEVVEGVKKKVDNLVKSFEAKFDKIKATLQGGLMKRLRKRVATAYSDFKMLFSEQNINNLKEKVEKKAASFFNAFKEKKNAAEVGDYLLALLCGVKSDVDQTINAPMEKFKSMVDKTELVHDALKKHSDVNTLSSIQAGREYAEPNALRQNCMSFIQRHNNAVGATSSNAGSSEIASRLVEDLQKDFDLTREQASGIVGNLYHESGGFNTLQEINPVVAGSRGGYGYAQWTGSRRQQFEQYVAENGLDPTSYTANYGFLKTELQGPEGRNVLPRLRQAQTVGESTQVFSERFLRPGVVHMDSRLADAQSVYENDTAGNSEEREGKGIFNPEKFNHPDPNSWSNLEFSGQVMNPVIHPDVDDRPFWTTDLTIDMRDYGGGSAKTTEAGIPPDIGYWYSDLGGLEMVNEVGKQMGHTFMITSAFRHKIYNQHLRNRGVGAAIRSQHVTGKAYDVSMSGVNRNEFVQKCRAIGFGGVGYYNTFIHVDLGSVRSWQG